MSDNLKKCEVGQRVSLRADGVHAEGTLVRHANDGTSLIRVDAKYNAGHLSHGERFWWVSTNGSMYDVRLLSTKEKAMKKQVLKVGDRVRGEYVGRVYLGTVFDVSKDGNKATIRRNDGVTGGGSVISGRFYNGATGWRVARKEDGTFGGSVTEGTLTVVRKHRAKAQLIAA